MGASAFIVTALETDCFQCPSDGRSRSLAPSRHWVECVCERARRKRPATCLVVAFDASGHSQSRLATPGSAAGARSMQNHQEVAQVNRHHRGGAFVEASFEATRIVCDLPLQNRKIPLGLGEPSGCHLELRLQHGHLADCALPKTLQFASATSQSSFDAHLSGAELGANRVAVSS